MLCFDNVPTHMAFRYRPVFILVSGLHIYLYNFH